MNTTNFVTSYERNFDITPCIHWVQNYWWLSIVASILYTIGIRTMENSKLHIHRDQVRLPLLLWNGFLAASSIVGTIRTVPELVDVFYQKGWVDSVCSVTYAQSVNPFIYTSSRHTVYCQISIIERRLILVSLLGLGETVGTRRHRVRDTPRSEGHISPLVPSCDRSGGRLAFRDRVSGRFVALVRLHEFRGSCSHVHLLRGANDGYLSDAEIDLSDSDSAADFSNVRRVFCNGDGSVGEIRERSLSPVESQSCHVHRHVLFIFGALF